jgi:serine/threonine protein kinase
MGVVYRAQDPAIGRTIAIKTIRLSDLTEPAERERLRERLFREAQSAGILSHPNIVTIYDILEQEGMAYIFMEFVNGPPLEKLLAQDQTPDKQTLVAILRQTANALDYAHKKGIVHRDIKPANIMIHEDGVAKITDFGVAKIVSQQMTQSGTMMGTPSYMSPEQIQGATVDGRADQFALAVIVYEVLTGEKPFAAEYLPSLLYKICREQPAPPQRLNTTLSPQTDAVLKRALAKSPDDRYPHCTAFITELERAISAKPDWVPLPRGSSQNMPTVAASTTAPILTPPEPPPPAVIPPEAPRAVVTAPASPLVVSAESAPIVEQAPVRQRERLEDTETHTVRNVVLAAASVVVIGVMVLIAQKWTAPSPAPPASPPSQTASNVAPQKPVGSAPEAPAVPAPAPSGTTPAKPESEQTAPSQEGAEKPSPMRPREPEEAPANEAATATTAHHAPGAEAPAQFTTNPSGAKVMVDDDPGLACTSPCQLPLAPGRHTLAASSDGYRVARRIFEMPRDAQMNVSLDRMMGTLSIITDPPGATIAINGQTRPEKSPLVLSLPVGTYQLRVAKGNLHYEESVTIQDGGLAQRKYTLE